MYSSKFHHRNWEYIHMCVSKTGLSFVKSASENLSVKWLDSLKTRCVYDLFFSHVSFILRTHIHPYHVDVDDPYHNHPYITLHSGRMSYLVSEIDISCLCFLSHKEITFTKWTAFSVWLQHNTGSIWMPLTNKVYVNQCNYGSVENGHRRIRIRGKWCSWNGIQLCPWYFAYRLCYLTRRHM